jgi:periplasmic protein TonB
MNPTRTLAALALCLAVPAACQRKPVIETEPVALTPPSFQYPEELWDAGVEGRTVLRILITEQGKVDSARVETPSGYAAFDSAALAGTGGLRFEPAKRDGTPVRKWVLLPVEFDIAPADSAKSTAATERAVAPAGAGSSPPPEKTITPAASAKPSAAQETPTQ